MTIPDCPICLCPLSSPWGSTSCGHPYHSECWDMVLASSSEAQAGRGGRNKSTIAQCAVCKTWVKSFHLVYIDLDAVDDDDGEDATDGGSRHERTVDASNSNEAAVEELKSEWQRVYEELASLLFYDDGSETKICAGQDDRRCNNANDFQGMQDVRDICATIDLTQSPDGRAAAETMNSDEGSLGDTELVDKQKDGKQQHQQHQKQMIQKLFSRLHQIHTTLMDLTPSSKSTLKSKFLALQKANTNLQTQLDILSSEKNTIQSKLNKAEQSLFDHQVQTEKEDRKLQQVKYEYAQLLEIHSTHQTKYMRDIDALQTSNAHLRKEFNQLKTVSGLADLREMEEMADKYKKMSQRLHDALCENRLLKRRMEERERRRGEMEKIRSGITGGIDANNRRVGSRFTVGKENAPSDDDDDQGLMIDSDRGAAGRGRGEFGKGSSTTEQYKAPSSKTIKGSSNNSNRAMDILNTAPSRKSVSKKSYASLQKNGPSRSNSTSSRNNQIRDISKWHVEEEDESDLEPLDVQLFMKQSCSKKIPRTFTSNSTRGEQGKPASHTLPNLRCNDSVSSVAGAGTKRMLKESATLSRKSSKHGHNTISSFFKPVGR